MSEPRVGHNFSSAEGRDPSLKLSLSLQPPPPRSAVILGATAASLYCNNQESKKRERWESTSMTARNTRGPLVSLNKSVWTHYLSSKPLRIRYLFHIRIYEAAKPHELFFAGFILAALDHLWAAKNSQRSQVTFRTWERSKIWVYLAYANKSKEATDRKKTVLK